MKYRNHPSFGALVAGVLSIAVTVTCMEPALAADAITKSWKVPRVADGHPDLQGNWSNATLTPFERPAKYGDRLALTAEEARALEQTEAEGVAKSNEPTDPKLGIQDLPVDCGRGFTGTNCGYNGVWVDPGTKIMTINGEKRSSMVVDPPTGRVPPMSAAAQARRAERFGGAARAGGPPGGAPGAPGGGRGGGFGRFDGPEVLSLGERCLMSFGSSAGPPMLPLLYNNNYQIVQSNDTVLILVEMVHDARIVRIGGKHRPENVRTWMGDSIGHWEGDTLVVETTNFRRDQQFRGAAENLKVIERFSRVAPDQILYKFTIDDPTTFSQTWGGEVAMNAVKEHIYEYACHEGNYALPGILAGAREQEKTAEAAK